MTIRSSVLVSAARTPTGKFLGALKDLPAPQLGAIAVREAIARAGLEVRERAIRGGTDGSRLSFMGLPTPNLFAGEQNFHSRLEWVSVQDMEKAVDAIVEVAKVWEEKA